MEDDAGVRAAYRTALLLAGYSVVAVDDGVAALRWLDTHHIDGIVLDLALPRLGGGDLQREIASHRDRRDIPIIVVTGTDETVEGANIRCVLRKPVDPEALVEKIRDCLTPPKSGVSMFER